MKVIQPSFTLDTISDTSDGIAMLRRIERYARVSHRSEDRITPDSWDRFLRFVVMSKGDWSVTEHCSVTAIVRIDRGCTHECVRHRIASYTQESTRFCNYGGQEIEFVEPVFTTSLISARNSWKAAMRDAEVAYNDLLNMGEPPDMARSVLPNATAATIVMTYNLRSWRQFFMTRTTKETHRDLRRVSIPLLELFQTYVPILYEDIVPEQKQSISLSRPR